MMDAPHPTIWDVPLEGNQVKKDSDCKLELHVEMS